MENLDLNNMYRQETPTGDCIIGSRIYGQCRQTDCLKPRDSNYNPATDTDAASIKIESARSLEENTVTGFRNLKTGANITLTVPIIKGGIVRWQAADNGPADCKIVPGAFKIDKIKILSMIPSTFGPQNSWNIEIKYTFAYSLQFFDSNKDPLVVVMAEGTKSSMAAQSTYVKTVNLNGGVSNSASNMVMASTLLEDTYDATKPYVLVQGEASPLALSQVNLGVYLENAVTWIQVDVNIGLYTMIKLFRLVNLMVQTIGDCQPDECKSISPLSPCTQFKSVKFPFDDFDPPVV